MKTQPILAWFALALLAAVGHADVVVLKSGKKLKDVVVSRNDDQWVVINPWGSRNPDMTWEIPEENRIPASKVEEVIIADPPGVEYRRRAAEKGLGASDHVELAAFCEENGMEDEAERHLQLALVIDPENEDALAAYPKRKFDRWAKGNPDADPVLREKEAEYLGLEDAAELNDAWRAMKLLRTDRELVYLERARRSSGQPTGRRDQVPLTLRSEEAPGATYCIYVPESYDPLVPTPLVVALHGGGRGGEDETLVSGSGEDAMPFYQGIAARRGWIVVCPTARAAPWRATPNDPWMRALLDEMALLYNVDESRIYLTGHSMGGFGTWHWGPELAEVWAACAPCAGGGGPNGIASKDLPVYIFHGTDDRIVPPGRDRRAAQELAQAKDGVDFVYTELDGVGHGFPSAVRDELFRFLAGRTKAPKKKRDPVAPRSSFDRKVEKDEIAAFGDPRKLPRPNVSVKEAKLGDLIDDLRKGGGVGAAACEALGEREDKKTAKAVAKVLGDDEATVDSRVLAARALGLIGLPSVIAPLGKALKDEDYRVLDEATTALGVTALAEAAKPLVQAAGLMGERYDDSFRGNGNSMSHTEYNVRLASFERLAAACAAIGDAKTLLPALEKELVERVLTPRKKPNDTTDARFRHEPPAARRSLTKILSKALVDLEDPRGIAILEAVAANWAEDDGLVREAERGAETLRAIVDDEEDE